MTDATRLQVTATEIKAKYFTSGGAFHSWLEANHDRATELLLGFYKRSAKRKGITWWRIG